MVNKLKRHSLLELIDKSNNMLGVSKKPFSDEHKLNISKGKKGVKLNLNNDQRKKLSERAKKLIPKNCKKVICTKTNIIYNSIVEASRENNINESSLRFWLKHPSLNKSTLTLLT